MVRVKEFYDTRDSSLENQINSWLNEHSKDMEVIDIKYQVIKMGEDDLISWKSSALLIYEEIRNKSYYSRPT